MINSTKRVINTLQFQRSIKLLLQINFNKSSTQKIKEIPKPFCLNLKSIYCKNNKLISNLWSNNNCLFSTLYTHKPKKIQSNEKIPSQQDNVKFQQHQNDNKIILQDLQKFISNLQKIHQNDSENYQKISAIIDKYINEKIFAFYSQKTQDAQSLVYFFQNQNLLQNYSTALNIKSSVEFRFRKFDEILTNIQNEIYMFKFLKVEERVHKQIQKLCKMYIFTLMLNDHDKLRQILFKDYSKKQNTEQFKNSNQQKRGGRRVSRKFYEKPVQKSQQSVEEDQNKNNKTSQSSLSKAFRLYMRSQSPQCLLSRALGYSVVGQVQKSLETYCYLLNLNRKNKLVLGNFLSTFIFFGNQKYILTEGKGYSSESIKDFVKNLLRNEGIKLQAKSLPDQISPEDAQYLVNSVLGFLKDQPLEWTDLPYSEIKQFTHSIYLIAENYYLSGQKQKATKMIEQLKNQIQNKEMKLVGQIQRKGRRVAKKSKTQNNFKNSSTQNYSQSSNIEMLIQFFQVMRFYDLKRYQKIKQFQTTFSAYQKKFFYQFHSIPNDILRSNIYQIFSQTYRDLKDDEKANQYAQLQLGNHCVNNTYQINQLQDIEEQIGEKSSDKQITKNRGIPPHYLNLLQQLKDFQVKFI